MIIFAWVMLGTVLLGASVLTVSEWILHRAGDGEIYPI